MSNLAQKRCKPCEKGTPPLQGEELQRFLQQVSGWTLVENKKIEKKFTFPDFAKALAFVNKIGAIAEAEGHHPDITLGWGKVKISLMTHKILGLSESDFVLAAKCDTIPLS